MHSFLSRLNTIFAYTLTVLAALTFLCFLSTFLNDNAGSVQLGTKKISVKHVPDYSATRELKDLGFVTFDIDTDVGHVFNWNVKMLFLYITAEYTTPDIKKNEVVIWDKIIERGDSTRVKLSNANTKYYFWDYARGLKGNRNVTLTLNWNVIPNAGRLPLVTATGSHTFQFPDQYASSRM